MLSGKAAAEYELSEQLKAAAESISRQDEEVRSLHESIRSIKHDMRNHLMVIASYLNDNDTAAAKVYTAEILDKLNSVHSYIETGNSLMMFLISVGKVGIQWNIFNALYYILTIAGGVLIQGAIFLLLATLNIYLLRTDSLKELFYGICADLPAIR